MKWLNRDCQEITFGSIIKIESKYYIFLELIVPGKIEVIDLNSSYTYKHKIVSYDQYIDMLKITNSDNSLKNNSFLRLAQELATLTDEG